MSQRSWIPRILAFAAVLILALPVLASAAPPRVIPGELIIRYKDDATPTARAAFRARAGANRLKEFKRFNMEHVKLRTMSTEEAIRRYSRDPDVLYVEPNYEITIDAIPNDPRFPELYGMRNTGQTGGTAGADIKATNAWDVFTGDPNIKIGIIDTGVDYNHPDLAANVWTNPGEIPGNSIDDDANGYVDDVHGYDFVNNDGDPFDDNGHGSHCAGTIAGVGNNNIGVTGVNWNAKVIGIKFLSGSGSGSTAGAIAGVQYAIAVGCKLTSNSWGGGGFSQALLDVINQAGAAGQLFVAASGNSSANTDVSPHYPSSYDSPYIIAVAATDHNDNLASFSNYGATTVDLAAPGVNILSCQPGGGYQLLSGTSMATPHVAGVVGLAMGRFPSATNLFIKQLLLTSADVKPQLAGKVLTGARLNAFLAIADPDTTEPGAIADLAVTEAGSSHLVLAWTATGDDNGTGRAAAYDLRWSTSPITEANFAAATPVAGPDPQPAGSAESHEIGGLAHSTTFYLALKALDEFGNMGALSNVATGTTLGPPDLAASPTTFSATLLTGATETQTLTLSNVGQGTLDYTIPTPELQFAQPVLYEYQPLVKGADDIRVGQPVLDGQGGPDGFGYRWVDSNEPGGPAFAWEDITGTGTLLTLTGDDATSGEIPIGFSFPFYGGSYGGLRVCTNGWLSFTSTATSYDNQLLPNAGAPTSLVAPMWDDMDFGTTSRVYTYGDASHFVVSWVGVPHYQTGGPYTFQAILYATGEIRFQYLSIGTVANSATVGIQNEARNIGLTTAFNADYIADNLAVRIVPLAQWLTVTPTSGRIPAGQSHNLSVNFNALGVEGGIFDGTIRIDNNDPDENPTQLAAQLHVLGAPDISLSPNPVDFGVFFVGANPTRTLAVHNPGTDALVVTNITSSDADVTPDVTAFTINPHQTRNVVLTFAPAAARTLAGTVTVESNDPDSPSLSVNMVGQSTPAPVVLVDPASFDVSLLTNTATTQALRLSNTGGSNYNFTAAAEILGQSGTVRVYGDADNVEVPKGGADTQFGPEPLQAGGPDVFGYTYQDSDEPGGPTFAWVDISATGTPIPLASDDQNLGPFPIGFSFPHYGVNYPSFRMCSNGWITLNPTNTQTVYSNLALPNTATGAVPSMLAAFWDDLTFSSGTAPNARAYYQYDGTRTIIMWKDVPRIGDGTHPNSFEIILYPTGEIVYQYLTMPATTKNSATIGMQNSTKNDGLQVVFNALYVKDNLAIRFRPPARFLTVSPPSGTVAPGAFLDLTVGFNAAGLFGGNYDGRVRIAGNDPVRPNVDVPATLHVTGVPDIASNPGSIGFGNVFIGFPQIRELRVLNTGTDVLNVSGITSSDAAYGVDQSVFSVPPLGQALLFVSFNPDDAVAHPATLTIASNDPDTPNLVVGLDGMGLVAPDIDPQPAAITESLPIPGTSTQTLTLDNLGGSDLNFVVGTLLTAASVPQYEYVELGKDEPDTRPGILGSGGPDIFGYRWIDSDDPGGPAFDWVDITGIGTPVPFATGDDNNAQSIPIGFNFPYYGGTFSTVNVCTNGWISFTNTTTSLSNVALPASGAPENLLAVFWDDLLPGTSPARVFRYNDGTRFIVSWVGVPRYSSGGPYTFQAILYPSGRIVYQYLDMQGTRLNEATVGIQNAAMDDGLTAVFNDTYVHDGLAVQFSVLPEYMTVSPSTGTVPAGGSVALNVNFDTNQMFGGTYDGAIRVASNDPDETVLMVPTHLTAVGTPHIAAQPPSVDFGSLYVGLTADRAVTLRNVGSDALTISALSFDNPDFSLVGAPALPVTLGQNGTLALAVRWTPDAACAPCTGNLLAASNDPDDPSLAVALTGIGVIPPEIGVTPATLKAALATTLGPTAIKTTKKLVVANTGGSDLNWTAQALSALPASVVGLDAEGPKDDPGTPGILGNGGPDAFGYRWVDSNDPLGPAFSWVDISAVGTPIPFSGDDQNLGWIQLPFSFPFYGTTYDSIRVCTNGWLSFSSTLTTYTNTALPSGGAAAPENLVAPFWDDLTFSTSGDAYYHFDGTKFIVSWVAAPRLGSGGPYTFQALLYPSGTIDFQYLDMQGDRLDEATIGIQNATKDVGLQVAYNAAYVANNLRVRMTYLPGWLTVSPLSGTTAAGGKDTITVTFDATGLADGDYTGSVRVASNDLDEPLVTVPADLHVGVKTAKVRIEPEVLNRSSHGRWVLAKAWAPQGMDARQIVRSSLLLQRTVPVEPSFWQCFQDYGQPVFGWRWWAWFKFDRQDLLEVLPDGNKVMVEMIGRVDDTSWFQGWDSVRVLRPRVCWGGGHHVTNPADDEMPNSIPSQSIAPLRIVDPAGATATRFELWYSPDAGETWTAIDTTITTRDYSWSVPEEATDQAMLEVVAFDDEGIMGSQVTNLFAILNGTTAVGDEPAPERFAMRFAGRNPANSAMLEFGMPVHGEASVRVYDLRGALVRELANGPYAPGWHRVAWDGTGTSGTPLQPGVYFVQANANGQRLLKRFVLIK